MTEETKKRLDEWKRDLETRAAMHGTYLNASACAFIIAALILVAWSVTK